MKKKYWFYFGMGTKRSQVVHKNGIVGGDVEFFPIIDIENSVMEEDQVADFHVVNFFEVPEAMFLEYKEELKKPRPQIVEPEPEEIDAGNAGGGLGALGGLLGGLMGEAAAGGAENAEAEEVHDETKVVEMNAGKGKKDDAE